MFGTVDTGKGWNSQVCPRAIGGITTCHKVRHSLSLPTDTYICMGELPHFHYRSVCGTSQFTGSFGPVPYTVLCMYLMGSNWSSAYRSASRGNFLLLLLCIVRLQLGSRWVRVRVSCSVRFSVRVSFTVRVSVRVIQVAILSCKL